MFCEFCSVWQVWGEHCAGHWESVSNMSWKTQQDISNSRYVICTQQDTTPILQTQDTSSVHNRIPPRYFKLKIRHLYTTGYHPDTSNSRYIICTQQDTTPILQTQDACTNDAQEGISLRRPHWHIFSPSHPHLSNQLTFSPSPPLTHPLIHLITLPPHPPTNSPSQGGSCC